MWSVGDFDLSVEVFEHCVRMEAFHKTTLKTWMAEVSQEQTIFASGGLTDTCGGFSEFFKDAFNEPSFNAQLTVVGEELHFTGTIATKYGRCVFAPPSSVPRRDLPNFTQLRCESK